MTPQRVACSADLPAAWDGLLSRRDLLRVGALSLAATALRAGIVNPAQARSLLTQRAEPRPASLLLAEDGRALRPIVISDKASENTRKVAAELADYLGRITGAKFEVQTGDGSSGIVLGTLTEFPTTALNEALAIRNAYDGREAFAIRTEPNRLLLIGATDLGTSHAAFRFLELLGCRWFFPAREWEVIPVQRKLANLTILDRIRRAT